MKYLIVFLFAGLIILSGCKEVKELKAVEIRDYEGEDLSSITDVKDVSIKGPQYINISNYKLQITGLVEKPRNYSYEEVLNHQKYSKVVELNCVTGWSAKVLWEGILLKDLFKEVEVKPGANTVIFFAYDSYSTSLPLDFIMDNDIMIAYKINNVTLTPKLGFPFELVAEQKWGYKWIKWITQIRLSNNTDYRGYWESGAYSNEADIDKPYTETRYN